MANDNQNNDFQPNEEQNEQSGSEGFKVSNQGQGIGGGKGREGGQKAGQFADEDDFEMQTDQSIAQAAPGQTATATNQGSSNA
ncbi:MAG TPA: hypothetical protein VGC76_09270 [Pyrinomonadaceae bacterium]|jgi:hypothetical protein